MIPCKVVFFLPKIQPSLKLMTLVSPNVFSELSFVMVALFHHLTMVKLVLSH